MRTNSRCFSHKFYCPSSSCTEGMVKRIEISRRKHKCACPSASQSEQERNSQKCRCNHHPLPDSVDTSSLFSTAGVGNDRSADRNSLAVVISLHSPLVDRWIGEGGRFKRLRELREDPKQNNRKQQGKEAYTKWTTALLPAHPHSWAGR